MLLNRVFAIFALLFIALQFIRFNHSNPTVDPNIEINASRNVETILERSCFDCHSNETNWPWYSNVAPVSWMVYKDVKSARDLINFSEWESYGEAKKQKLKKLIFKEINSGMPKHPYLRIYQEVALDDKQKETMRQWSEISSLTVGMKN
jgi:Haem-binding domain